MRTERWYWKYTLYWTLRSVKYWPLRLEWWWLKVTGHCPQCTAKNPYHKMDCSRRYDEQIAVYANDRRGWRNHD